MTTDPTITIAGLTAERDMLRSRLRDIAISVGAANEATCIGDASRARVAAERDALAAQLAEVRAELDRLRATDLTRDAAESTAADQLAILRADLASERAHLAACRTRIAGLEQAADERSRTPCNGSCDIALASRQVGPDGIVPRNARECAELWEREAARLWHDYLTVVDALAPSTSGPEHAAEIARDLRHRVAELEARPVNARAALISVLTATKHGPGGRGGPGDCDADCVKCEAERALASLGAPPTSRDTVRDAMERAAERFGGPDGVFSGAGFSNALMHAAGLSGAVDGRLVRAILAGRCDVQDRGNGHYQIAPSPTSPPAARPVFAGVSVQELAIAADNIISGAYEGEKPLRAAIESFRAKLAEAKRLGLIAARVVLDDDTDLPAIAAALEAL